MLTEGILEVMNAEMQNTLKTLDFNNANLTYTYEDFVKNQLERNQNQIKCPNQMQLIGSVQLDYFALNLLNLTFAPITHF